MTNSQSPDRAALADERDALVKRISAAFADGKDSGGYDTLFDMLAHTALKVIEGTRSPSPYSGAAVTDEMVTAAMREFERMSSVLRYREKDKWHSCDIMGMRDALRAAFALLPAASPYSGADEIIDAKSLLDCMNGYLTVHARQDGTFEIRGAEKAAEAIRLVVHHNAAIRSPYSGEAVAWTGYLPIGKNERMREWGFGVPPDEAQDVQLFYAHPTLPRDAERETIERIDTMVARVYFNAWSGAIAVTEDGKQWRLSADEIKNALNAQPIRALPSIPPREGVERENARLRQTIKDTIESLERNSTSAPVVECLKAALSPSLQSTTEQADASRDHPVREAIKSHVYTPDYQAMGDCRVCGHGQNKPWHLYSLSPTSVMPDEGEGKS